MTVYTLPTHRLPKHILLTRMDGWALRELIHPIPFEENYDHERINRFLNQLYNAMLHIELEGRGEWNLPMTKEMVYVINDRVKSGAWEGADGILIQTWMALHEIEFPDIKFEVPATEEVEIFTQEEADAIRDEGSAEEGDGLTPAADGGGVEFPVLHPRKRVHIEERLELSDN